MSPVSGHAIAGGDVADTEALGARPPDGVTYTPSVDALADGTLIERGRRPKHGAARGPTPWSAGPGPSSSDYGDPA